MATDLEDLKTLKARLPGGEFRLQQTDPRHLQLEVSAAPAEGEHPRAPVVVYLSTTNDLLLLRNMFARMIEHVERQLPKAAKCQDPLD
jgi:hypothetical protein